ncbi:hypothetical protein PLICBS_009869 [Purpureocillium lilacinum]|uniref:uncharacterized protein n=1 Tax=Purpureocillium lilacinum TaxID=33203 RepID=UPI00208955D6|nr:hypothetical protein PLICBS_009869 [Purpureocillium lilacinum]
MFLKKWQSSITPQASMEFSPKYATLLPVSQYSGLLVGAVILGALADNFGRRAIWQLSIFGVSIVTLLAASSSNWAALNWWVASSSFFAGGNLAIDLAILVESIPRKWSFMVSGLACIWGLGNTLTGLIGEIQQAVDVLNHISAANRSAYGVTVNDFIPSMRSKRHTRTLKQNITRLGLLFHGSKRLRLMIGLGVMWTLTGIAYPLFIVFLPYYLAANGAAFGNTSNYITYRDFTVSSVVGIFGPVVSMYMVSTRLRSRISMAITAAACVAFSGAFTTVKSEAQNLAFSSMTGFWLNAVYAILYGYTPQALEVEHRGLGAGLLMAMGRLSSLTAPFIATFADVKTSAPIWVACGCYAVIGLSALILPVDTVMFSRKSG